MKFHFLLSYAGGTELENMTERDKLALLQRIAASTPSEEAWNAILELFASWPSSPAKQYAIDWADSALDPWDDELRSLYSSSSYLYVGNELADFAQIARTVQINGRQTRGNEELTIMARSPHLKKIRRLSIYQSEVYGEGLQALVTAPWLHRLTHLSLASLTLHIEELTILFTSAGFNSLSVLTLKNIGLQRPKLLSLSRAPFLEQLTSLDLSYNSLDINDVVDLASTGKLKRLERLNIGNNPISPEEIGQLKRLFTNVQIII